MRFVEIRHRPRGIGFGEARLVECGGTLIRIICESDMGDWSFFVRLGWLSRSIRVRRLIVVIGGHEDEEEEMAERSVGTRWPKADLRTNECDFTSSVSDEAADKGEIGSLDVDHHVQAPRVNSRRKSIPETICGRDRLLSTLTLPRTVTAGKGARDQIAKWCG
jgi:hypothetical protein